ncbi:uncharacterized protein LOC118404781 isoform X1 [Branchiostoma floridae]|uniref:Uncharacterized protein LOC118404781 isoform X1 n=2 Tax=Branchiostoma floridae TaxID=7739 RepID=A0A9J7HI70_BRAFL|nr:uncharacterized protein LOC118404781 isoform X1 [Branchiostoma floridae]
MAATFRRLLATAALLVLIQLLSIGTTSAQTTAAAGSTAAPSTAAPSTAATTAAPVSLMRYEVVLVYEAISIWAIILILTMLVADASMNFTVVKNVAIVGPIIGMLLCAVPMILAPISPNNGSNEQGGFTALMIQSTVCAVLSFFAAFSGYKVKQNIGEFTPTNGYGMPQTTLSLLGTVGMMPAIAGTIFSALNVAEGYQWPGIIVGCICTGLMTTNLIWYTTRAMTGKNMAAKAVEDKNTVSMNVNVQ